jgi:hypothetical protein
MMFVGPAPFCISSSYRMFCVKVLGCDFAAHGSMVQIEGQNMMAIILQS